MTTTPPDPTELADLTPELTPVASRINDPAHAVAIVEQMIRDNSTRLSRMMVVQGNIDGNPPVSAAVLEKGGRKGNANINWREGKGHIANTWPAYYDLTNEVPVCIQGDLEYTDPTRDGELMRGFAEYFHNMVFGWAGFDHMEQLRDWQMLVHGVGIMAWANEWDYRPKTILATDIYFEEGSDSNIGNCEKIIITYEKSAGELWRLIENEAQATAAGWNPKSVKLAIMSATKGEAVNWKWERLQQAFKNGDHYASMKHTKRLRLATLLVEEMGGRISQHVIQYGSKAGEQGYLYSKVGLFADWSECICLFPFDVGSDGSYHSIKGLGTEIAPYCNLSNRIKNTTADLVLVSIKPMFQMATGTSAKEFQLVKMAGFNIVPAGASLMQIDASRGIQPAIEVSREMSSTLMSNTGTYRQNTAESRVEQTAKEAMIRASDQAKLSKGSLNRFLRCKSRQYAEMWRRAVNPDIRAHHPGAKEVLVFQAKCKALCDKMGVPVDALQKVTNIRAYGSLGLGNPALRIEIANAVMDKYDYLPGEVEKRNALRIYFSSITSKHLVDELAPSLTEGEIPTEDNSIAALEDNALNTGGQVILTPRQDHIIHLSVHVSDMENDVQSIQQGADIHDIAQRLDAKGTHSHEHMLQIQDNPTRQREAKAFGERLRVLASICDQLRQNVEEQDAAAAKQPQPGQPDPEMEKVQGGLKLKEIKQQGDHALKVQKQQFEQELQAQKQQFEAQLALHKTGVDIQLADATTASDIKRKATAAKKQAQKA